MGLLVIAHIPTALVQEVIDAITHLCCTTAAAQAAATKLLLLLAAVVPYLLLHPNPADSKPSHVAFCQSKCGHESLLESKIYNWRCEHIEYRLHNARLPETVTDAGVEAGKASSTSSPILCIPPLVCHSCSCTDPDS